MKRDNKFFASLIGIIVSSLHVITLVYYIISMSIQITSKGISEDIGYLEIAFFAVQLVIVSVALALSAVCMRFSKNFELNEENKRILISTISFDFILAFLFFVSAFANAEIFYIIFCVLSCLLILTSGSLFLIDLNEEIKIAKQHKEKLDNAYLYENEKKHENKIDN